MGALIGIGIVMAVGSLVSLALYLLNERVSLRRRQVKPGQTYVLELQRIEQAKRQAMDDIRRRRQRTEDQLRRLTKWL